MKYLQYLLPTVRLIIGVLALFYAVALLYSGPAAVMTVVGVLLLFVVAFACLAGPSIVSRRNRNTPRPHR